MFRFRAFGIPVTVDGWFLLGMFFIYSWSGGGRPGMFAAVAIAVFTLIHELGHALTARHYGCAVEIRLNLLMGWASFTSVRPLSRLQRIVISVAGPLAGLVAGMLTLVVVHAAMGPVVPTTPFLLGDLWRGVVWAAIIISLINLLPMWPLDGGHVTQKLLEIRLGERRALRVVAVVSLGLCAALLVLSVVSSQARTGTLAQWRDEALARLSFGYRQPSFDVTALRAPLLSALWGSIAALPGVLLEGLFLLPVFCALSSFQLLGALRTQGERSWVDVVEAPGRTHLGEPRYDAAALAAERDGWSSGTPGAYPKGWGPSPWLRAWTHLRAGDTPGARMALAGVASPQGRWIPPRADQPELRSLVPLLGDPPPVGDRGRSLDLLMVLGFNGSARAVADYATRLYAESPDTEVLYRAAAGLATCGEPDAAMAWLQRAAHERPDADRLAREPGYATLHARFDYQQLLAWARSTPSGG